MITDFLITCSGANKQILNQCPTERTKFVGIGATILITALLACISGSYFLSFVFANKDTGEIELPLFFLFSFGIIWGALIFNLDRSIIVSLKKSGKIKEEFRQAWLRILLAVFIGLVIATPLELRLFKDEINAKVIENRKEELKIYREKNRQIYNEDILLVNDEIHRAEAELREKESRRKDLYESFKAEAEGTGGTFKLGKGPVFAEKKEEFDKIDTLYNKSYALLNQKRQKKDSLLIKINSLGTADEMVLDKMNGPEAKIKALYQLSGLHWFMTLLFILLETLPVFMKLISKKGPYDEILGRVEYEVFVTQQQMISNINDEINNSLQSSRDSNKLKREIQEKLERIKFEKELSTNESILAQIATQQGNLGKAMVDKWYNDEISKVR